MKEKLLAGTSIVVDRYSFSGVAFSTAKGMDSKWCWEPEVGLLAPDAIIYLDMPIEDAAQRGEFGGERYEKIDFQKTVQGKFKGLQTPEWNVLDARQTIEELETQIKEIALKTVTEVESTEFNTLK